MNSRKIIIYAFSVMVFVFLAAGCAGNREAVKTDALTQQPGVPTEETMESFGTQAFTQQAVTEEKIRVVTQEVFSQSQIAEKKLKMTRAKPGLYQFQAEYPGVSVGGIKNAEFVAKKLNDNVVGFMRKKYDDFAASASGAAGGGQGGVSTAAINYSVIRNSPEVFAVRFDSVRKNAGEAASHRFVDTLNLDANSGNIIILKDLFKADSDYLKFLSDYALDAMKNDAAINGVDTGDPARNKAIKDELMAKALPKEENFRNFNITGQSIIIYFTKLDKNDSGRFGGKDLSGSAADHLEIPFERLSKVIDSACPYVFVH